MEKNIYNTEEPTLENMKVAIKKSGGLFYQYRPCRRNLSTIHDIENLRHGVVYAQTPLNMNDPFDSMAGFSANKIFNETIYELVDSYNLDTVTTAIITCLIRYRAFGKSAELILLLNEMNDYFHKKQVEMHMLNIPFESFIATNMSKLYKKSPLRFKNEFSYNDFNAFALLLVAMGNIEISEENVLQAAKLDDGIDKLYDLVQNVQNNIFVPAIQEFLSKITVSCFSSSGWDNQLMWAHYSNSYQGICIEYDFNKMENFVGFMYPVRYTKNRPLITLKDMGFSISDKQEISVSGDTDIQKIFSFLLAKNDCWKYEYEWRLLNIGEANTPCFVDVPFIKSVTLGLNIDPLCKRLLWDVCNDKGIECYQLRLSTDEFKIYRDPISADSLTFDLEDELSYVNMISEQFVQYTDKLTRSVQPFELNDKETDVWNRDLLQVLTDMVDCVCLAYFFKNSINTICENNYEEISQEIMDGTVIQGIRAVDDFIETCRTETLVLLESLKKMHRIRMITKSNFESAESKISEIISLVSKIESTEWHKLLLRDNLA